MSSYADIISVKLANKPRSYIITVYSVPPPPTQHQTQDFVLCPVAVAGGFLAMWICVILGGVMLAPDSRTLPDCLCGLGCMMLVFIFCHYSFCE